MGKIFLLFLMCGMAIAADPEPSPSNSDVAVVPVAEPAPTPDVVNVEQVLRQWVRLSQSIDKLQKTVDELTEEVEMFSAQLAEEINTKAQSQPTPTPAQ